MSSQSSTVVAFQDPQEHRDQVLPEASEEFVTTSYIDEITERSLCYLEAGYPVHFCGPAGTGKTTLAFHVAECLGRPVRLIHGDDEFGSTDLFGGDTGYRHSKLVDNYIHSVMRTEEELQRHWVDNRLTTACRNGETLIYDEFNRSRAEANNALLSILSEGIVSFPKLRHGGKGYLEVHEDFRAIFTSNPEEYAGVHRAQDALLDRMITIQLRHFDRSTEVSIAMARSGLPREDTEMIVDIVRQTREVGANNNRPTVRAAIAIARVLAARGQSARPEDPFFRAVCHDVLAVDTVKASQDGETLMPRKIDEVLEKARRERQASRIAPLVGATAGGISPVVRSAAEPDASKPESPPTEKGA